LIGKEVEASDFWDFYPFHKGIFKGTIENSQHPFHFERGNYTFIREISSNPFICDIRTDTMCGDDCIKDCPHYRVKPELYQKCHFEGAIWTIVFIDGCLVHLTSLDGKQFKQNIHISTIQPIEESDGYPEE